MSEYNLIKTEMKEYQTARQNVDKILENEMYPEKEQILMEK